MQKFIVSKVAANNSRKNQLSLMTMARSFSAGPKANPFDKVKTSLGSSAFYKLPALADSRLGKCILSHSFFHRDPPILH